MPEVLVFVFHTMDATNELDLNNESIGREVLDVRGLLSSIVDIEEEHVHTYSRNEALMSDYRTKVNRDWVGW